MAKFAAALLEAHEDDLVFENGTIFVKGAPASGKAFAESRRSPTCRCRCRRASSRGSSDEAFFEPANNTYPFGCHISMLEIDRETGEPKLLKLVAVDDAGNLINPLIVEGQIHGGLAQGIGQAMIEEVGLQRGRPALTGSFMDYAMPRATDFPRFELDATVTPTPVNPLGAKGVGEAGTLGSTPCIVDAAVDALSEFGVKHIDMMLRPEKLWRIIHGRPGRDLRRHSNTARDVARRRAGEAAGGERRRQAHRRRPQPRAADEAAPERAAASLIDIARIPGLAGIREKDGKIEIGAGTVHHDVATSRAAAGRSARCVADAAARSATRRCAIAARSAAAWRTPIRRPTTRP